MPCINYCALNQHNAIHFSWPLPLWKCYEVLPSSPSWTYIACKTSSGYRGETSGRPPSSQKLQENNMYLKLEKCEFHQPSIQFLGYVIDKDGVNMDQGKVHAVTKWPIPSTIKELQRFLGFANFYHWFIISFSQINSSLTSLLPNKPKSLFWTPAATTAF